MSKGRITLIGALVALAALLVAFGPAPDKADDENTLRVTLLNTPDSLDPGWTYASEGWSILSNVYDPLLTFKRVSGEAGNELVPNVAEAMPKVSPDGRTYTFTVRKGIKFAPPVNRELKASDVKYTYDRLAHMNTQGSNFFNVIDGFQEAMKAKQGGVRGVTADDRTRTVTFRLKQPDATFLYSAAVNFSGVVPKGTPPKDLTQAGFATGSGPYMLESFTPGSRIRLVRNPNYRPWSPDLPKGNVDAIDITIGVSDDNAMTWLMQGKADLAFNAIPRSKWGFLKNSNEWNKYLHLEETNSLSYAWLNTTIPPFDNVKVRQAFNWAVDRRALVKLGGGASIPTSNILPSMMPGSPKQQSYPKQDMDKAKQLISESGVNGGPVIVWYETNPATKDVAQYLQNVLSQLGFSAKTRAVDRAAFSEIVRNPRTKAQMGIGAWGADFPEAYNFMSVLAYKRGGSPYNYGLYGTRDDEVDRIHAMGDLEQRATEWGKLDTLMMTKDAPLVPMTIRVVRSLAGKRVGNYISHPVYDVILSEVTVDGTGTNNGEMHDGEVPLAGRDDEAAGGEES